MMRSLSSAVAGLRTHQTKMDVIGNNIANVNTYAFKAGRTTFADVYYQSLSNSSSGTSGVSGGQNPTQIGYGSAVATIDVMMGRAGMTSTDRAMDVYISGEGFLVSKDPSGNMLYTRLGILGFDSVGNLIDSNGNLVQGFPTGSDGKPVISADGTISGDAIQSISVNPELLDRLSSVQISPNGTISGTLPGDTELRGLSTNPEWINNSQISIPTTSNYSGPVRFAVSGFCTEGEMEAALGLVADSITSMEMGDLALPKGDWKVTVASDGKVTVKIDKNDTDNADEEGVTLTGYLSKGKLVLKNDSGKVGLTINIDPEKETSIDASLTDGDGNPIAEDLTLDYYYQMTTTDKGGNIVQYPETPTLWQNVLDDTSKDTLTLGDITIGLNKAAFDRNAFNQNIGTAKPAESETIIIGSLVLAKFPNAAGLDQSGTSYFSESFNSGLPIFVMPGREGTGSLSAGSLEMSNVDVSNEFTDMITTQRGFQANTRIITVSDEMLQELVNLKR